MVPQVSYSHLFLCKSNSAIRCTSLPENLDVKAVPRTPVLTEELVKLLDSGTLRREYGIDNEIVVRQFHAILVTLSDDALSLLLQIFHAAISIK